MSKKFHFLFTVFILLAVCSSTTTFAQTVISGPDISGTWTTAGEPYILESTATNVFTVPVGQTLTIEAGVNITVNIDSLVVNGKIIAQGESGNKIHFNFNNTDGLIFYDNNTSPDSSKFIYTIFEQCTSANGVFYISNTSKIAFHNCEFSNNTANSSAPFIAYSSNFIMKNSLFESNTGSGTGQEKAGAIYLKNSNPDISNTAFNNNSSTQGGAIYLDNSDPTLSNLTFSQNSSTGKGGAIYCLSANPQIQNSSFSDNTSNSDGGAIYCVDSDLEITGTSTSFSSNSSTSGSGGAIFSDNSISNISDAAFNNNSSNTDGGAIYHTTSELTLNNTLFDTNSAAEGGAIYSINASKLDIIDTDFSSNTSDTNGGAIFVSLSTNPLIDNCTFSNNSGTSGSAIYCSASNSSIHNCIFNNNTSDNIGGAIFCDNSNLSIHNSLFDTNTAAALTGGAINITNSTLEIISSTLKDNSCGTHGGAIYSTNTAITIDNSTLESNSSTENGGAVYVSVASQFEITNTGVSSNSSSKSGGGVYLFQAANPFIKNVTFSNNTSADFGGAIQCDESNIVIDSTNFINNEATNQMGGAIHCSNADPVIKNSLFENSTSGSSGGAISGHSLGLINLKNTDFETNTAQTNGGAIHFINSTNLSIDSCEFTANEATNENGGGIICFSSYLTLSNSTLHSNTAGLSGGALYSNASYPEIVNCDFTENSADTENGGAISCYDGEVYISKSYFQSNLAALLGGAVLIDRPFSKITNSYFFNNYASSTNASFGGAICYQDADTSMLWGNIISNNESKNKGGGIAILTSSPVITNNHIVYNEATAQGAVYYENSGNKATLENCIIWGNEQNGINTALSQNLSISFSTIQETFTGTGNLSEDPKLVSHPATAGKDEIIDRSSEDFSLQETSPCINTGNLYTTLVSSKDILDQNRIVRTIDIGAIESSSQSITQQPIAGFGKSIMLNGSNSYLLFENFTIDSISGQQAFTFMGWINPSGPGTIITQQRSSDHLSFDISLAADGTLTIRRGTEQLQVSQVITMNKYTHIAVVYDGLSLILYINGHEFSSTSSTSQLTSGNEALLIGAGLDSNGDKYNFLPAVIDEFSFISTDLSTEEIFNAKYTYADQNCQPFVYWNFDELYGSVVLNRPYNDNNGVAYNINRTDADIPIELILYNQDKITDFLPAYDVQNQPISYSLQKNPQYGDFQWTDNTTGEFSYSFTQQKTDTFSYQVSSSNGTSATYEVSLSPFSQACGKIYGVENWRADTIKITCDIIVEENASLNISQGTYVQFQGPYKIQVKGDIQVEGAENDSVIFNSVNPEIKWRGIELISTQTNEWGSNFSYAKIKNTQSPSSKPNGGALYINTTDSILLTNIHFIDNTAIDNGGAIFCEGAALLEIQNSIFEHCKITNPIGTGGGIALSNCDTAAFYNNLFFNDTASAGAAIALKNSGSIRIFNQTIADNHASSNYAAIYNANSSPEIINCIVWNNTAAGGQYLSEGLNVTYSNIENGYPGQGNISSDPRFQNSEFHKYQISASSPCLNAGSPSVDIAYFPDDILGNQRINFNDIEPEIDMGAYEYSLSVSTNRIALEALYYSTNGHNWKNNTNWLSEDISTWYGVSTTADGLVYKIDLSGNNLQGTIPPEISHLRYINEINLSHNQITGELPQKIINLFYLVILDLSHNQISELPPLTMLELIYYPTYVNVDYNHLDFGDIEINLMLSNFIYQHQANVNEEEIIVVENGQDYYLTTDVEGSRNKYQWTKNGNLISLANESLLRIEDADINDIGSYSCIVTSEIDSLSDMELKRNPIHLVTKLGADSLALVALYESTDGDNWNNNDNWLTGNVEDWYGISVTGPNKGRVTSIQLAGNNLNGTLPQELEKIDNLEFFNVSNNQLSGNFPTVFENMEILKTLSLNHNSFSGTIDFDFSSLVNLRNLKLDHNLFKGKVPESIKNLNNLNQLQLQNNNFHYLPSLNNLFNLQTLYVQNNLLTFENIDELSFSQDIEFNYSPQAMLENDTSFLIQVGDSLVLDVNTTTSGNNYQWWKKANPGANDSILVSSLSANSSYTIYNAAYDSAGIYICEITNPKAPALTLLRKPITVSVEPVVAQDSIALVDIYNNTNGADWTNHENWLIEPVYNWYGVNIEAGRVVKLDLSQNNLNGTIPESISNLTGLEILNLNRNLLTGHLPNGILNLKNITSIDMSYNSLSGEIPSWNNFNRLIILDLSNNNFSKLADLDKTNLPSLQLLSVTENKLTFEDVENNKDISSGFYYQIQDSVNHEQKIILSANSDTILTVNESFEIVGEGNKNLGQPDIFLWKRNGNTIQENNQIKGVNNDTLFINNFDAFLMGSYTCEIKKTNIPSLVLYRKPLKLEIDQIASPQVEQPAPYCIGDQTVKLTATNGENFTYWFQDEALTDTLLLGMGPNLRFDVKNDRDTVYVVNIINQVKSQIVPIEIIRRPTVTVSGNQLTANQEEDAIYQWYKDGEMIGTSRTINVTEDGNYKVTLIKNGCSASSVFIIKNGTEFYFTSMKNIATQSKVILYPNPAEDKLYLKLTTALPGKYTLSVLDVTGKIIRQQKYIPNAEPAEINISNLRAGMYLLKISSNKEKIMKRFLKK